MAIHGAITDRSASLLAALAITLPLAAAFAQDGSADREAAARLWEERTRSGLAAIAVGEDAEALVRFRAALLAARELADDPRHATAMTNLALARLRMGELEEVQALLEDALAMRAQILGQQHPSVIRSYQDLASFHRQVGNYETAEFALQRALILAEELHGADGETSIAILDEQARLALEFDRFDDAERYLLRAVAVDSLQLEDSVQPYIERRRQLARLAANRDAWSDAAQWLGEAHNAVGDGDDRDELALDLAQALLNAGQAERAGEALNEARPSPARAALKARVLAAQDESRQADALLEEALATAATGRAGRALLLIARADISAPAIRGDGDGDEEGHDDAGSWLDEAVAIAEGLQPDDQALLSQALFARARLAIAREEWSQGTIDDLARAIALEEAIGGASSARVFHAQRLLSRVQRNLDDTGSADAR